MKQVQIKAQTKKSPHPEIDRRTPSGKVLPY